VLTGVPAKEVVTPDWSDNGSFLRVGMNAAALWAGEQPCCNHTPRDTIEKVQPDAVQRAGVLALAILRSYLSDGAPGSARQGPGA
jgi:hypothetical protein